MKKIRNILIIFLITFVFFFFSSYSKCKAIEGEETLKLEYNDEPVKTYQKQENNEIALMSVNSDTVYVEGNYNYKIQKGYSITATNVNNIKISEEIVDIAIITKYTGTESIVTIPKTLGGKRVYEIDNGAFYQNTSIKKLIIPDKTVGMIGEGAFADCTNLSEISFGNAVKNIASYAFQNTAVTTVKLPATLEFILNTSLYKCEKITSITIDSKNVHYKAINNVIYEINSDNTLKLRAYPWSKKDKTFIIPNNVKEVEYEAIINDYLETLNVPAAVESILTSNYALTTSNLKNIYVNSSNQNYSSVDGVLFSKDKKKLYFYPSGRTTTTYNIPNGTTSIETNAFYNSNNLKYINIAKTVSRIEVQGFAYARGLQEITIPSNVTYFGAQIFMECPNLRKVTISANAEVLSYLTFFKCSNLEEVIVNGNIKTLIKGAFYYCPKLTKITLPSSLEKIEFGAVWCCRGLEKITIPANVVLLEEAAFYDYLNRDNNYWSDVIFDISKTKLKLQKDGNYMALYDYKIKGTRDYNKAYEVLNLVNQERKKYGYTELKMDKNLLENAMVRAEETVTYFEHERPNGLSCTTAITQKYGYAAENIALGQTTAKSVMTSWMNSSGHKTNILEHQYSKSIGIGCYLADDGRYYWTQIFTNGTPETVSKPQNKQTTPAIKILRNRLSFRDVKTTDWSFNAIKDNVSNSMILGYNSTRFAPNEKITRGMLVTILHRMEGQPYVAGTSKFSDVQNTKEYYYVAVKWAAKNNIVSGYSNGKFGPNDPITREQLAVILNNYCRYKGKYKAIHADFTKFKDSDKISSYAKWGMNWAVGNKIINGSNGNLNPQGTATRAEAAAMLSNYCRIIK